MLEQRDIDELVARALALVRHVRASGMAANPAIQNTIRDIQRLPHVALTPAAPAIELARACGLIHDLVQIAGDAAVATAPPAFFQALGETLARLQQVRGTLTDATVRFGVRVSSEHDYAYVTPATFAAAVTSAANLAYGAYLHYVLDGVDREVTVVIGSPTHDYAGSPWDIPDQDDGPSSEQA